MADIDYKEIGSTGLKHDQGVILEEWQEELKYGRDITTYKMMATGDPVIGAMLYAIEVLLRGVNWVVRPATTSPEDEANAEFLDSCRDDMSASWEDTISEILSMLAYGFSYFEIVYKRRLGPEKEPTSKHDDNRIGWRKFAIRSQDTLEKWELDEAGGVKAFIQRNDNGPPKRIPIEKSLHFRTSTYKNNPQGRSVLRSSYRAWYFKRNIEDIEGVGIERDLAGLPVMYLPAEYLSPDAPLDKKRLADTCRTIITSIRRDEQEGVLMPNVFDLNGNQLFKLELLSAPGRRQFDTTAIIARYNVQILITVLADFIILGQQSQVGSYSLGETKTRLFTRSLNAYAKSIAMVLNRFAVPRLFKLNGLNLTSLPYFEPVELQEISPNEIAQFISQTGISLAGDVDLENNLRERMNMPPRPGGIAIAEDEDAVED